MNDSSDGCNPLHTANESCTRSNASQNGEAGRNTLVPPRPVFPPPPPLKAGGLKKNSQLLLMRAPKQNFIHLQQEDGEQEEIVSANDEVEDSGQAKITSVTAILGPTSNETPASRLSCFNPSYLEEARVQCNMALPVGEIGQFFKCAVPTSPNYMSQSVLNMVAFRIPWMISLTFVGRLGETELAACAMATTLANVTGMSVLHGLSSAQATLSSQVADSLTM
jgi:hypothetical protein